MKRRTMIVPLYLEVQVPTDSNLDLAIAKIEARVREAGFMFVTGKPVPDAKLEDADELLGLSPHMKKKGGAA